MANVIEVAEASRPKPQPEVKITPPQPKEKDKAIQVVEVGGYVVELMICKLSGNTVICSLMITNTEKDRELYLKGAHYHPSRMFDNSGNEYRASRISLANKSGKEQVGSLLVAGVSTKATISFEGVSPEANMITLLEIKSGPSDLTLDNIFQFRNIPLSR